MKSLLYLLLLITTNLECYSQLLFGKNNNGIQIANITGINSDFIINNKHNENILYSNFEGQRIRLSKLPERSKFLTLKIWGKLKISDEKKISKSISSLRLWKNPNLLVAPKIYHHHYPKLDSETGMHLLQIPLGRSNFVSTQQFHFSLPTWNLAKVFGVKKIEVVSTKLPGTQISIDQNLIETNINELLTEQQWINKFQFIDEWFVLIITCQVIIAFALIRYYMFAQAYLCLMFFCLLASYWYQWPFQYDVKKSLLAEANFKLRQIVWQAIDIPKKVEYELNQDIDSLIEGIKSSNFKSQNSINIINKLSDEAEKLGLEILLEYRNSQRTINLSDSTRRSLNKPILIKLLGVIRTLIQEYVGLQREKKQDAEQNDRFNKKLKTIFLGLK